MYLQIISGYTVAVADWELQDIISGKYEAISFVRNKIFSFMNVHRADDFPVPFQPRASPPTGGLPWARIYCPFRTFSCPSTIITPWIFILGILSYIPWLIGREMCIIFSLSSGEIGFPSSAGFFFYLFNLALSPFSIICTINKCNNYCN